MKAAMTGEDTVQPDRKRVGAKALPKVAMGVAALGITSGGMIIAPAPASACASAGKVHNSYTLSDGTNTYTFATSAVKQPPGCVDTNVSYSSRTGAMRGRYATSSGTLWGNQTPQILTAGTQSPWKVVIQNLATGTTFNHGHESSGTVTTWRY